MFGKKRKGDIINVTVTPSVEDGNITLHTSVAGQVAILVMNMQDEATRQALIALGWTPPNEEAKS